MTDLNRALNSVGKECFIHHYEAFRACAQMGSREVAQRLAEELLKETAQRSSPGAQGSRVSTAKSIFLERREREALTIIVQSRRLPAQALEKAARLLRELDAAVK